MMQERSIAIRQVLVIVLLLNIFVAAIKGILGYATNVISLIADSFHSVIDSASNIIGLVGITIASRPIDETHPYGHEKFESLASLFIGVFIFLTVIEILSTVISRIFNPVIPQVDVITIIFVLLTMCVNIFVTKYERKMGERLKSDILIADAAHTFSDLFATSIVLINLILVAFGLYFLDSIIAIIICAFIVNVGVKVIKENAMVLTDSSPINIGVIKQIILEIPEVKECHKIRARGTEKAFFIDCHILVDPKLSIIESHEISTRVERLLKKRLPGLKDVVIHIEPYIDSERLE